MNNFGMPYHVNVRHYDDVINNKKKLFKIPYVGCYSIEK